MHLKPMSHQCTACGTCCRWGGWACLYDTDVPRLAAFLGLSVQAFVDTYTRHILIEYRDEEATTLVPYLALKSEGEACIFLDGNLCRVHAAKPVHCAESPFLAEFLLDPDGFDQLAARCPGMGCGAPHALESLRAALDRQAERDDAYDAALARVDNDLAALLGVTLPEPEFIPDLGLSVDFDTEEAT